MLDDALRLVLEIWPPELRTAPTGLLRREDFRPYQHRFVDLIRECVADGDHKRPGMILALPPGAGKTVTALTAICDDLDDGLLRKVLITAPVLVSQTTWPDEFDEWEHLKGRPWTLIRVEDDDSEMLAIGAKVYEQALTRHQERWNHEVALEARRNPSRASAQAILRARWEAAALEAMSPEDKLKKRKPKFTPSDLAEKERQAAVADAKEAKLSRLAASPDKIHIINKEALPWLWKHFGNGARFPYDLIIGDDLREFRSGKARSEGGAKIGPNGKRLPAPLSRWGVLSRARKCVKAIIELTGTPTPKGIEDAWGLAFLVDLGERLGLTKTAFLERWFDVNKYSHKVTPKGLKADKQGNILEPGWAFYEIMDRLRDIMFSLDEKDIGGLPPYIPDPIRVQLPDHVLKAYKDFERKMVSEEYEVEAVNGGVLHGKLLQFCIAEGTEVLTGRGWVPIERVSANDEIWDGEDWVTSRGSICNGFKFVVECFGVSMTADHKVLTKSGWREAQDILNGESSDQLDRLDVRLPDRSAAGRTIREQPGTLALQVRVRRRGGAAAVHDLVDCGPRHRYVVRGKAGPVIVHNCNGSMYRGPGDDVWIHDVKIDALKDLVARLDGKPLLIAYTYQFDVARILKAFPHAEIMTPSNARDFKRRWNNDEIGIGLVHRASAAHGLNMQKGTGHMCEYGLTTDAELYLQFLKRLYRPGRKTSVINHVIIAKGTIDEDVFPGYLNPKIDTQERVLAEVRLA